MLTEILKKLLSNQANADHILGASRHKKDGLYLCWRPPNTLIITRPGSPGPSPQELTTVQNHLKRLGWQWIVGKLASKPGKGGVTWYYWKLTLNRARPLL